MGKNTVKIISIRVDRHEKTVQTKIRLLLYVCAQGLGTLLFHRFGAGGGGGGGGTLLFHRFGGGGGGGARSMQASSAFTNPKTIWRYDNT